MARSYTLRGLCNDQGQPLINVLCQAYDSDDDSLVETAYSDSSGDVAFTAIPDDGNAYIIARWGNQSRRFPLQVEGAVIGSLTAGGGAVSLSSTGITLDCSGGTEYMRFYYSSAATHSTIYQSSTENLVITADSGYLVLQSVGALIQVDTHMSPGATASFNLGDATNYWNDISYKTLTDRGCPMPLIKSPVDIIKGIKTKKRKITIDDVDKEGMGTRARKRIEANPDIEFEELDHDSFPDELLDRPEEGKVGIVLNELVYTMLKTIQELAARIEVLESR